MRVSNISSKIPLQLLYIIFILALFQAGLGILQYAEILPFKTPLFKAQGSFINPGIFGLFMAIGFVVALCMIIYQKGTSSHLSLLILAASIITIGLILSKSRTAFIAALTGGLFVILYRYKSVFFSKARKFRIAFSILLAVVFCAVIYLLWLRNTVSVSGRFLIWRISFDIFKAHPFLGIGAGNFYTEYSNYQAAYFAAGRGSQIAIDTADINYYAFNELLKIAVENGIPGVGLFITMVIASIVSLIQHLKHKEDKSMVYFAAVFITILVFSMFSYPFQDMAINTIFLICIAIAASISKVALKISTVKHITRPMLLVVNCFLLLIFIQKINAIINWRWAKENILAQEGYAIKRYQQIFPYLSNNGSFLFNYGAELADIGLLEQSAVLLDRAALYGNSVELCSRLGRVYEYMNNHVTADKYYTKAAYMVPKMFVPLSELFAFYKRTQQVAKAKDIAQKICNKAIKIPSAQVSMLKNDACVYVNSFQ